MKIIVVDANNSSVMMVINVVMGDE